MSNKKLPHVILTATGVTPHAVACLTRHLKTLCEKHEKRTFLFFNHSPGHPEEPHEPRESVLCTPSPLETHTEDDDLKQTYFVTVGIPMFIHEVSDYEAYLPLESSGKVHLASWETLHSIVEALELFSSAGTKNVFKLCGVTPGGLEKLHDLAKKNDGIHIRHSKNGQRYEFIFEVDVSTRHALETLVDTLGIFGKTEKQIPYEFFAGGGDWMLYPHSSCKAR